MTSAERQLSIFDAPAEPDEPARIASPLLATVPDPEPASTPSPAEIESTSLADPIQAALFDVPHPVTAAWKGMPSFLQEDHESWRAVKVHFADRAALDAFARLVGQKLTAYTRSIWYPQAEIGHIFDRRYTTSGRDRDAKTPRYPIYVISKGRWESRLTSKALEKIGVAYRIVVEPQEHAAYAAVIDPAKILTLPFSNLGLGSIPARNWVWDHSLGEGAARHWILDDNIGGFYRLHRNLKTPVADGAIFRAAEDFTDRYENVAQSGFNYFMFAPRKSAAIRPFTPNTRIYSCILNRNDLPFRWRGRYNEDTDLSLRILKAGWSTILFNAFLAGKSPTMKMKGGNTDELYQGDGRLKMAESLRDQHPDLVQIVQKWGRWQHQVDYRPFRRNKFVLREGAVITDGADDYEMSLEIDANDAPDEGAEEIEDDRSEE